MKESIITDTSGFQLKIRKEFCVTHNDMYRIQFIRSIKKLDQTIESESTYEFFINQQDLAALAKELIS